jgi:hypothetical protein
MLQVMLQLHPGTGHSIQPSVGGKPYPSSLWGLKAWPALLAQVVRAGFIV